MRTELQGVVCGCTSSPAIPTMRPCLPQSGTLSSRRGWLRAILLIALVGMANSSAQAGGPKYVAGVAYFNPAVVGQPIRLADGPISYFVDQGSLSGAISNQQAVGMVDAAAAFWNAVPTAGVNLTDAGSLAEDVNGSNVQAANQQFTAPADVTPQATATPIAVVFDADGSVINALLGAGASVPDNCAQNGVLAWIDNFNPQATFAHGVIVLNGLCATEPSLVEMMNFQLQRAFGRILGLDNAQVNPLALTDPAAEPNGTLGWPVMQPNNGACGATGGVCIPDPTTLRYDDQAAISRLYPVTSVNQSEYPGHLLTAANTVSIQGTISFRNGQGMQGVNVIVRPLDANGNPMYEYTVTAVSGEYFAGNRGNAITGYNDALGNPLDRFGGSDPSQQGFFDLSAIPLPPGMSAASYQVSFEAINPLNILNSSVGPYQIGNPAPSGTMPTLTLNGLSAGTIQPVNVTVEDSAGEPEGYAPRLPIGVAGNPHQLPGTGAWSGRLGAVGQTDWFTFAVRANRSFTVVTQALNEAGQPTTTKAMPTIGVWDGFALIGAAPAVFAPAQNDTATGVTYLAVNSRGSDIVRLAVADQRGDGRPDYTYQGWVLYADSVIPARLPSTGGTIVIRGFGFHSGDTVKVGGIPATAISIEPTEITATVAASTAIGSQDVEVDDLAGRNAATVIPGGVSFDARTNDVIGVVRAPQNMVPLGVPVPFSVVVNGGNGLPAGSVTVTYTVGGTTAELGCGRSSCTVTTSGDGLATLSVTPISTALVVVTAGLDNGSNVQAHFYGGVAPALAALTPTLHLAAGATVSWPVEALALAGAAPAGGIAVQWLSGSGLVAPAASVQTDASGMATVMLIAGPLAEGQTTASMACVVGTSNCVNFAALGSRPEFAYVEAVSGASQSLVANQLPMPVVLRVRDMDGVPMGGGTVAVFEALYAWSPPCPTHGRCAQAPLLEKQSVTLTSALDGTVSFLPLSIPGVATNLTAVAATGDTSTLTIAVEQHP